MSFLLKNQIRLFSNKRSFHTSQHVWEEWTKNTLRRMKKPELIRLAKENKIDVSGTKVEIIIRLLGHQTARIVSNLTPEVSPHLIKEAKGEEGEEGMDKTVDNINSVSPNIIDAVMKDDPVVPPVVTNIAITEDSSPSLKKENVQDDDPLSPQVIDQAKVSTEINKDWINAFEAKVIQRSPRKANPPVVGKPHPLNDNIFKKKPIQHVSFQDKPVVPLDVTPDYEDMDQEWVKAFDLKLDTRGTGKIRKTEVAQEKTTVDSVEPIKSKVTQTIQDDTNNNHLISENPKPNSRSFVTTAIGSGMLVWYFGGSDGFSHIWNFFSS